MLPADKPTSCSDCEHGPELRPHLGRRDFLRAVGTSAAAAAVAGLTPLQQARAARAAKQAEAEAMVFELFKTMDADQKKKLVLPWDYKASGQPLPARLMTANAAVNKESVIGLGYDKKQADLLHKVFKAISNGDEGYRQLSRNGKFDNSGAFENIGALIYGEPAEGKKFSLVFCGHHITVRCDGNSEEKTAFGGPLYYGHSPSGFAATNVFYNQAKAATELFDALDEKQRKAAVTADRAWQDGVGSVRLPRPADARPGVAFADLSADQKKLIEKVMRELVSPYRKEDGDEVMEIVKANGGLEKMSLAFYTDNETKTEKWSFWRLEGPGFVWSFRALPHIHTFVNISSKLM